MNRIAQGSTASQPSFAEHARWNAEWQAVEFGVESGDAPTGGVVPVPRRVFQRLLSERPTPEQCVEAYYLQRTRFESLVNLIEGAHFMFRNPTAHEAPIKWNLCKEDAV